MKPRTRSALNLALFLGIAASVTGWTLPWIGTETPAARVVATPTADPLQRSQPVDMTATARLFGTVAAGSVAQPKTRLVGVIAEGGRGRGVALLATDNLPAQAYRVGESVTADRTLAAVRADGVTLTGKTGTEDLALPAIAAPSGITPAR
jgi:hypothetical protein